METNDDEVLRASKNMDQNASRKLKVLNKYLSSENCMDNRSKHF